ncbi:MAG: 4Fe-4S dicluster domain-containing protein [bacterium]|nr:4Fe-4S dicluster domain-containing protein [bacterium]
MLGQRLAMVIDLHRCVGCAACDIACKSENNVPHDFHWSNHIIETAGSFPEVKYRYIPTLCNHCGDAPCVEVCPTGAMYKDDRGLTLHDAPTCIGCRSCQLACPYGAIYFNEDRPFRALEETKPLIKGCTPGGAELIQKTGENPPHYNPDRARTADGVRRKGVVEKCTLCDHRLEQGKEPWCVVSCPAEARTVGDINDPKSKASLLLAKHSPRVLNKEQGTHPHVFYIREF